jgi:hypothetical protein
VLPHEPQRVGAGHQRQQGVGAVLVVQHLQLARAWGGGGEGGGQSREVKTYESGASPVPNPNT